MEREPSSQESIKQEIVNGLRHLKTGYKDGIPDEVKHSTSTDSGWRVQKFWFHLVGSRLFNIMRKSWSGEVTIPKELFDEIHAYHRKLTSDDNPSKHRLTTQEDIDEAEAMIDKVIAELEK